MKEAQPQADKHRQRLDQLLTLSLTGECTAAESLELAKRVKDDPQSLVDYIELVADSTNLRGLSEASGYYPSGEGTRSSKESFASVNRMLLSQCGRWFSGYKPYVAAACVLVGMFIAALAFRDATPGVTLTSVESLGADSVEKQIDTQDPIEARVPTTSSPHLREVATILRADNVVWAKGNLIVDELSRVSTGDILHLSSGEIELVFDRAVRMCVRGPAMLEIRSPSEVYSRFGVLSARVGKGGVGFAIETPNGRIVDLGTEFGVAVDEHGSTAVAVFSGAVDLTYGSPDNLREPSITRRLIQGQALTLAVDGSMRRLVSFEDNQFPMFRDNPPIDSARPASIFTGVTDNIREGLGTKSYMIVQGGLREDVRAYFDRQHEWNGVDRHGLPPILRGADLIVPFNEDKYNPELRVEVGIGQPARVFIFMSPMAQVPDWLSENFTQTDMRIGLDESGEFVPKGGYGLAKGTGQSIDTQFTVWQQDIEAPTTVELGSVRQARRGFGYCMYGIAAVPLEVAKYFDAQATH